MTRTARGLAPSRIRWRAMARVGVRMMVHDKLKMAGTLAGVVFAVLLATQQAGVFLGLLHKNTMFVANATAVDLWIVPPATREFQPAQPLSESLLMQARGAAGVAWAEPIVVGNANVALPGGGSEPVTLVGTPGPRFPGGPWNLVAGEVQLLERPQAVIFEDSARDDLGGINLGSIRELNDRQVQAAGFTWGLIPFGPPFAFAEIDLAREILRMPRHDVSFVLIGLEPDADPIAVRDAIAARVPEADVVTRQEYVERTQRYLLTETPIGLTFGSSALFGLIVGFVVVALTMFAAVVDNLREFGTLKAIGATNGDLTRLLVVQSLLYAITGTILGLGLVGQLARAARSPNLAIELPPLLLGSIAVLMVLMCLVASSLALLRLRRLEPAMVFR